MAWLKNVILDLAVTAVIAVWLITSAQWAYWVVLIYTPLLVLLKVIGLSGGVAQAAAQRKDETPVWFYHLIYAANLMLLLTGRWWIMAAAWAAIWVLSAYQQSRTVARKTGDSK